MINFISVSGHGPLGPSSCIYYGSVNKYCHLQTVDVRDLPQSCSTFVFEVVFVDFQYDVSVFDDDNLGSFNVKRGLRLKIF